MNPELFEVPESLSPKLKWLREHGLITKYDPELESCPESPETGDMCYPWVCGVLHPMFGWRYLYGVGRTEEDAMIDYAIKNDIPHWSTQ